MASVDYLETVSWDGALPQVKKKFHQVILEALETGPMTREELKILYRAENIGVEEEKQVFNAWGGLLRYIVERGEIYQEYGVKRFHRLRDFQPLPKKEAELEIARRYFSGFGPVSLADARYYFKENKSTVLDWMKRLDLKTIQVAGEKRFYLGGVEILRLCHFAPMWTVFCNIIGHNFSRMEIIFYCFIMVISYPTPRMGCYLGLLRIVA